SRPESRRHTGVPAPQEPRAIGLPFDLADGLRGADRVHEPGMLLVLGARATVGNQRPLRRDIFGLHEELREHRMRFVRSWLLEHELGIGGELDHAATIRAVEEGHAPYLCR